MQKPVAANPFISLFKHLSVQICNRVLLSEHPFLWCGVDDHSPVWTLTSIRLLVELTRGTGKLANRPGRLKGWAFFFLEKKRKSSYSSWPTRVAQSLREPLAKIIQIILARDCIPRGRAKGNHEAISCSASQTGRDPLAALILAHPRFLLFSFFLFFMIKSILELSIFHDREFSQLLLIYLSTSYAAGWGARLSSTPRHRSGSKRFTGPTLRLFSPLSP